MSIRELEQGNINVSSGSVNEEGGAEEGKEEAGVGWLTSMGKHFFGYPGNGKNAFNEDEQEQVKPLNDYGSVDREDGAEEKKKAAGAGHTFMRKYFQRSFVYTLIFGYPGNGKNTFNDEQKQEAQIAEVASSAERALVCFALQFLLYFGSFFTSNSKECYVDQGIIGDWFKDLSCLLIMLFSFQFLTAMAISEFYIKTIHFFQNTESGLQKILIILNLLINSMMSLSLIYSTALILKGSTSFLDIIMNSIAIFFVADMDDMMVTDFDEDTLKERTVQAFLAILKDQSKISDEEKKMYKTSGSKISSVMSLVGTERLIIRVIAWVSFAALFPYSIYTFFQGTAHCEE